MVSDLSRAMGAHAQVFSLQFAHLGHSQTPPSAFACRTKSSSEQTSGKSSEPEQSLPHTRPLLQHIPPLRRAVTSGVLGSRQVLRRKVVVAGTVIGLAAVAAGAAAVTALGASVMSNEGARREAQVAVRRGMKRFVEGNVAESLEDFDKALKLDPSQEPYLWQRGLSLYYAARFQEGAQQFQDDVAVNPNDTEEAIWCFLCEAQLTNAEDARKKFLKVGRDPRPVMRAAYKLFQTGEGIEDLLGAATDNGGHDSFYALLYLGLYHESQKNEVAAREAITAAVNTPYGQRSGDFMAKLGQVHCLCRGWSTTPDSAKRGSA